MSAPGLYIGLMSGTSLDGVDAALVEFGAGPPRLRDACFEPYPDTFRTQVLERLAPRTPLSWPEIARLDHAFAEHFARAASKLLEQANVNPEAIRALGSHGQTVWHAPEPPTANSLQLGDPSLIAVSTGIPVVADFRRADLAAGGQGAPLVPAFHAALFRNAEENRAVLNLGGIANLTCLPADPEAPVTGFDTGPGNLLLDAWCRKHLGQRFDRDGEWARSGSVHAGLLEALLADPFFARPPPKSTGREYFHLAWLERAYPVRDLPPRDVQATLTALTACSAAGAIRDFCPRPLHRLLVCGGGAHNAALLERLQAELDGIPVETTDHHGIPADWVEAMAFAWLAKRRLEEKPGNLPEVTGARRPVVLGGLYLP